MEEKLSNLNIHDKTDINVLLLGETGVGKSTFINSIANYLQHQDLETALNKPLLSLIPCMFHIIDDEQETCQVVIGNDANESQKPEAELAEEAIHHMNSNITRSSTSFETTFERITASISSLFFPKEEKQLPPKTNSQCLKVGDSATKDVKTYVFTVGKTRLRLIDTPGMADCKGVDRDDINCENILSYIGQLHELHAICFLFKPNDARVTVTFEYCLKQILSRLEKSAANNIIFVFTNARGTHYRPGETIASLKEIVQRIKKQPPHVDIQIKDNVFCFDNESFRYLAAVKQGINLRKTDKKDYIRSWKQATEESWKLIRYIVGDADHAPLVPHFVKNSACINEARRVINHLGQPLADISELILDNLRILKRKELELNMDYSDVDRLKAKLYIPIINLKVTKLTKPTTVCCHHKCRELLKIDGLETWNYKQRCHDPCYLQNVPQKTIGAPQLKYCAAMDQTTQKCTVCGCADVVHMHIYYMTEKYDDKKIDVNIQDRITTIEKARAEAEHMISEIKVRKAELESEKAIIIRCAAKFARFVQSNAIIPVNDAYKEYIKYFIERENGLGENADKVVIYHLQDVLKKYDEINSAFDHITQLSSEVDEQPIEINPKGISAQLNELYSLKHNGMKIKELYQSQKTSRKKEYEQTEYVHPSPILNTTVKSKKSDKEPEKKMKVEEYSQKNKMNSKTMVGKAQFKPNKKKSNKKIKFPNHNPQQTINPSGEYSPDPAESSISIATDLNENIKIEIIKGTQHASKEEMNHRRQINRGASENYYNQNHRNDRGHSSDHHWEQEYPEEHVNCCSSENIVDNHVRGYGPPNQAYGTPNQPYGPHNKMCGPSNQVYGPPKQAYSPPNQVYGPPNRIYGPPNQGYGPSYKDHYSARPTPNSSNWMNYPPHNYHEYRHDKFHPPIENQAPTHNNELYHRSQYGPAPRYDPPGSRPGPSYEPKPMFDHHGPPHSQGNYYNRPLRDSEGPYDVRKDRGAPYRESHDRYAPPLNANYGKPDEYGRSPATGKSDPDCPPPYDHLYDREGKGRVQKDASSNSKSKKTCEKCCRCNKSD